MPAKKLERVSCKAKATARPPTPRAVRTGVMEMPKPPKSTRPPVIQITTFTKVRDSPVAGIATWLCLNPTRSAVPDRLAMATVTEMTSKLKSSFRAVALGRCGSSAVSMAV